MDFNNGYRKLRDKIKSTCLSELILRAVVDLRKYEENTDTFDHHRIPLPWILLGIIKMAFLYSKENFRARQLTERRYIDIYNLAFGLDELRQLSLLRDGFQSFCAATAFQQFWIQKQVAQNDFARANFLFKNSSETIKHFFKESFGLEISTYTEMLSAILLHVMRRPEMIFFNFRSVLRQYGFKYESIEIFISMISKDRNQLKEELSKGEVSSHFFQFGEHSSLYKYPAWKTPRGDLVFMRRLLERSLVLRPFEYIKKSSCPDVISDFADAFEDYALHVLESSGIEHKRESEIAKKYNGKKTDALIVEDNLALMIEFKSVRPGDYARANPTPEIIKNAMRTDVVKAILQGHELSQRVFADGTANKFALIVVGYDDINLGPMADVYDTFFREYCEKQFSSGAVKRGQLEKDSIFLMSISDFETLCAYCKKNGKISGIILKAIDDNKKVETCKFDLLQSIPHEEIENVPFIQENFEEFFSGLQQRVAKKEQDRQEQ